MPFLTRKKTATAVAALSIQIADRSGKTIQLLPAGRFKAVDGRPATEAACTEWVLDAENAAQLIAAAASRVNPSVIDYEHQTLLKEKNGQPAPAAGWFKTLEWREGVGLFATDVEWTPAAAQAIADGEYRFISPVIRYHRETGRVTGLVMAGLVNYAGIDGMQQASLAGATFFNDPEDEEQHMNKLLAALLAALGLDDKASEDKALAALNAFIAKSKEDADQVTALSAQVAAAGTAAPDPAKFVPIETVTAMQAQLSALTTKVTGGEVDKVIETALAGGKLLPAQEKWARDLGAKDLAALKAFVETAPQIPALGGQQTQGKPPAGKEGELTAEQLAVCSAMGLSAEDFKKTLAEA
ncbi:MAG: phage protease [Burkholderiaceae bacterium]